MKEIKIQCDKYKGKTLMEALAEEGVQLGGTCGGMGSCGKCKVIANDIGVPERSLVCLNHPNKEVTSL